MLNTLFHFSKFGRAQLRSSCAPPSSASRTRLWTIRKRSFFSPLLYCHEHFDHITRSDASILPPKYKYEYEHVRRIHCSKWPRWKEQVSFDGRRMMESVTSGIEYSKTAVIRLFVYSMYYQWQQGTRFADPPCPFYPSVRQPTINSILHSEPKKKQSPYSSQPS